MRIPSLLLCAAFASAWIAPAQANGQYGHIGPSGGAIAGGIIGIAGGILGIAAGVSIVHSHHVLTGCIMTGTNGTELKTADAKTWSLEGNSVSVKPGDRVKVHGTRVSHQKTASGAASFKVDKLVKDYGSCPR